MVDWIAAVSLLVIAVCAVAYVTLRISDELRFRNALNGVENAPDSGSPIIIPRRSRGPSGRRKGDYKRRKAEAWIDKKIREAGDG